MHFLKHSIVAEELFLKTETYTLKRSLQIISRQNIFDIFDINQIIDTDLKCYY